MINLGDKVRDKITGFEGVVIGITTWIYGCKRLGVQAQKLKDEKPVEPQWFDEPQMELITETIKTKKPKDTGGPIPISKRHNDPTR